jgi:predicted acyltransferase (DUF342 family)
MICPGEFLLNQYADGELPEDQIGELAAHIELCAQCRQRIAALEAENQLLVRSLQGIDWWEPGEESAQRTVPGFAEIGRLAAIFVCAAVLLRIGFNLILSLEPPGVLDWLNPLSLSGQVNWLANGFFYLLEEGSAVMTSIINSLCFVILSLMVLGGLFALTRRRRGTTVMISLMALMIVSALPGYAMEVRRVEKGRGVITVAPGETIDDTLVVFAEAVNVKGTITGDLVAFAREVNIQGTVMGNVIGFGQRIYIEGNVDGDIYGFAQTIQADGQVGGSLWSFAQNLIVGSSGRLNHDATMFGANVNVDGDIGRDLTTLGAFLDVGGEVGRNITFRGGQLSIHEPSVVGGDLDARVRAEKNVQIDPGVTIAGNRKVELEEPKPSRYLTFGFYFGQLLRIAGAFLAGLLLFWLFPPVGRVSLSSAREILTSGGIGFLAAVAAPVAAIIMVITLIGIPIAVMTLAFWLLGLYLAKIVVAGYIGGMILGERKEGMTATALNLIIGLAIIIVATNLPFIGGVLNLLLILIGLGGLLIAIYKMWRRSPQTESVGNVIA